MLKHLSASLGIAAIFITSTALAIERSELEKSRIKAATDCVAQAALKNPDIITLYRQNRLNELTDWIVLRSNVCDKTSQRCVCSTSRFMGKAADGSSCKVRFLPICPALWASE